MKTLVKSYTKKDFKIDWFSGSGAGGQNRNKHRNCCRITHIPTGITTQSTRHKERVSNQKDAFKRLAGRLLAEKQEEERRTSSSVVRTYHFERNLVTDYGSGLKLPTKPVMDGDLELFRINNNPSLNLPNTGRL